MAAESVTLVIEADGMQKRHIKFAKGAGFEALKNTIANEFGAKSIVDITYKLSDEDDNIRFCINADVSLDYYLEEESPLPPLRVTLSPSGIVEGGADPVSISEGGFKRIPDAPGHEDIPVVHLPPLPMCALRLEAVGYPPKTVEIPPERATAMGLKEFQELITGQFDGQPVDGAAAEVPGGITDSEDALHALLAAGPAEVTVRVLLRPPPTKTERKKLKKQRQKAAIVAAATAAAAAAATSEVTTGPEACPDEVEEAQAAAPRNPRKKKKKLTCSSNPPTAETDGESESDDGDLWGPYAPLVQLLETTHPENKIVQHPPICSSSTHIIIPTKAMINCPQFASVFLRGLTAAGCKVPAGFLASHLVGQLVALPNIISTNPAAAEAAYMAIALTSQDHPRDAAAFCRAGVAPPLVASLAAHPALVTTHPSLAGRLLEAIFSLIREDQAAHARLFAQAGVVPPLAAILAANRAALLASPHLATRFFGILSYLSTEDDVADQMVRAQIPELLVGLLRDDPTRPTVHLLITIGCMTRLGSASLLAAGARPLLEQTSQDAPRQQADLAREALDHLLEQETAVRTTDLPT
ncbi:hypothetical protein PAPYR_2107 [Paratrimastix pyriformis]|uniref:Uncharacterized protein n=1 Tax=Paratrimastix pyriformis TaxID=342808 RepID=A0ABQ8UQU2_9EUKA|nr:hypothetical protein PAPYR_2107 [Paratrimastix pyriformis]